MTTTSSRRCALRALVAAIPLAAALPAGAQTLDVRLKDGGHILRRTSFGVGTNDIVGISLPLTTPQSTLISNYLNAQIGANPAVENPNLDTLINTPGGAPGIDFTVPFLLANDPGQAAITWNILELADANVARACMSSNQLQELMTNFWEEHFSTNYWSQLGYYEDQGESEARAKELAAYFEWRENQFFRENWSGPFEELLVHSAMSPTMLIYLDNVDNTASAPNENYAREVLELHTLGVDPVTGQAVHYDLADIIAMSQILTGWTLAKNSTTLDWEFSFDGSPAGHSTGNKTLSLGTSTRTFNYDSTFYSEGNDALRWIANLPETADFVSRKIYRLLVSETITPAGEAVIQQCVTDWATTGGNIGSVVDLILTSSEFQTTTDNRWSMARTPLESLGQMVRGSEGRFLTKQQAAGARDDLDKELGQELFRFPSPDGFPGDSLEQISTADVLNRIRFNQRAYSGLDITTLSLYPNGVFYDPRGMLLAYGVDDTNEIAVADWFLLVFFQGNVTPLDTAAAHDFILRDTAGNPAAMNFAALLGSGSIPDLQEYYDRLNSFLTFLQSYDQSFQK